MYFYFCFRFTVGDVVLVQVFFLLYIHSYMPIDIATHSEPKNHTIRPISLLRYSIDVNLFNLNKLFVTIVHIYFLFFSTFGSFTCHKIEWIFVPQWSTITAYNIFVLACNVHFFFCLNLHIHISLQLECTYFFFSLAWIFIFHLKQKQHRLPSAKWSYAFQIRSLSEFNHSLHKICNQMGKSLNLPLFLHLNNVFSYHFCY